MWKCSSHCVCAVALLWVVDMAIYQLCFCEWLIFLALYKYGSQNFVQIMDVKFMPFLSVDMISWFTPNILTVKWYSSISCNLTSDRSYSSIVTGMLFDRVRSLCCFGNLFHYLGWSPVHVGQVTDSNTLHALFVRRHRPQINIYSRTHCLQTCGWD